MRKILPIFFFCKASLLFSQQKISGKTSSENDMILTSVLVVNISNDKKVYSNSLGEFSIEASEKDEIRFVKNGYERVSKKIAHIDIPIDVVLIRIPEEIKEVEIFSTTGNLSRDSKRISKIDRIEQLQKEIGLPKAPENPREVPAELNKVLLETAFLKVDIQAIYDLISGKARRQKRRYQYEDVQNDITWIRQRIDDDYFVQVGIPKEKIAEFLEFSLLIKPELRYDINVKNINNVMFNIEDSIPIYVERLKKNE